MGKKLSRLGIFVFFDPQGIVDGYVTELLRGLRPNLERLVIVSNTELDDTAEKTLRQYADDVFVRGNHGLDAAAFKAGMIQYCGWEEVERYDEVVLVNDTFFGPIHSFDDMFSGMADRDVDFWGMSAGYPSVDGWGKVKYGYIPAHIQTFFVVFRKNMVCSPAFREYWEGYDDTMDDFVSVVSGHEMIMTRHFQDLGFRWEVWADTEKYNSPVKSENFNIYHHHSYYMLRDMRFPVLKKKVLSVSMPDFLYMNDLEEPALAMDYIQKETDYDTGLSWDNVLRLYNVTDLYQTLHLNFVLPSVPVPAPTERAALVYHVANPFFARRFAEHAAGMSGLLDVYLIPESQTKQAVLDALPEGCGITVLEPSGQSTEMGAFLLRCGGLLEKYTYLGFVHDVGNPNHDPMTVPESTVFGFLQNVANDSAYVTQVLNCLESNPRLGVLGTPFPIHHDSFANYGNEWGQWFDKTRDFARDWELRCCLDEGKMPIMTTGAFWCRTAALKNLWNKPMEAEQFRVNPVTKQSERNEVLKRILPYAAQSAGYYSGIVMHTDYASMRLTSQQYMLDEVIGTTRRQLGCAGTNYPGYIKNLQTLHRNGDRLEITLDSGQFGLRTLLRIYLERRTPRWLSGAVLKVYRALKGLLRR